MESPALHEIGPGNTASPRPPLPSLVGLLRTWQIWSYRDSLTRKIADAREAGDTDQVQGLTRRLNAEPADVGPLDALAANHELISLLEAGQSHAIRAARKTGASWQQIATATGTTAEQACADCLAHLDHANPTTTTSTATHRPSGQPTDHVGFPS